MDKKLSPYSLLLLLIFLGDCTGNGSTEMDGQVLSDSKAHVHTAHANMRIEQVHSHSSPHMHHMDSAVIVFFFIEDLKEGNTIPIYFPRRDPNSSPHLLSKVEDNSIPFSSQDIDHLLHLFSFPQGSPQATAMENTLRECEAKPIKGETKLCATSLESMHDFTKSILGLETNTKVLSTTHLTKSNTLLQKYKVMAIEEIQAPKQVSCHTMPYPYAVFYCHYQESESKVFKASLTGENGDKVDAIAVCHMDTSNWGSNHVSFKVLGIEPGSSPVCHFFPSDNFVYVPYTTSPQA